MKIIINYNSAWRNSFLDGDNNSPLPKGGRNFVASGKILKEGNRIKRENSLDTNPHFIKRDVTIDTVMGVLNRLIGDQRKLYQSRQSDNYFFKDIEPLVSFEDDTKEWQEMVYLQNANGNKDPNAFTGLIDSTKPLLSSSWAKELWNIVMMTPQELDDFNNGTVVDKQFSPDPFVIAGRFEYFTKDKNINVSSYSGTLYAVLETLKVKYGEDAIVPYLSATGKLPGISTTDKGTFSKKDFMSFFSTGGLKPVYGNPYFYKEKVKGVGEVSNMLTKADGTLTITIDVPHEKAMQLSEMIENAGVSAFTLGKKGVAYVKSVRL